MLKEQVLSLAGPDGNLDVRLLDPETHAQPGTGFIMCHPHPLMGGTMDNKVVTTLVRAAAKAGLPALRFNFRGVGNSEGVHANGIGEQDDLATIMDYARNALGWKKVILAGFSFGSGVSCLYSGKHPDKVNALFMIAPAVHHFDAPTVLPHEFDTHVYMGDADEVVPFEDVENWVNLVTPQPHWQVFEGCSHFFHGRLNDLKSTFLEDLEDALKW